MPEDVAAVVAGCVCVEFAASTGSGTSGKGGRRGTGGVASVFSDCIGFEGGDEVGVQNSVDTGELLMGSNC